MFEFIDRRRVKAEARAIARDAQVPAKAFYALYFAIIVLTNLCAYLTSSPGGESVLSAPVSLFITLFTTLVLWVVNAGTFLYAMAVRRGERAEFFVLFDGFSFAGKLVLLRLMQTALIFCGALLFVFPAIIIAYRYRFALLNLCENPDLSPFEALRLSGRQTRGYKNQLFLLDLSYLGWELLATLPTVYVTAATSLAEVGTVLPGPYENALLIFILESIFLVAVSIFYIPVCQLAELAYFETAVRTSGQDPNRLPPKDTDKDETSFF